jgi:hypothetical protein
VTFEGSTSSACCIDELWMLQSQVHRLCHTFGDTIQKHITLHLPAAISIPPFFYVPFLVTFSFLRCGKTLSIKIVEFLLRNGSSSEPKWNFQSNSSEQGINWPELLACVVTELSVHYYRRFFSFSLLCGAVTFLPEGVIVGFPNFRGVLSHKKNKILG